MARQSQTSTARNAMVLSALRIAVGALFLIFGQYKVFGTQFTLHGGFEMWINRSLEGGAAYPFFIPILRSVVLPHAKLIAFTVAYGELAIGLALVSGKCVRTASSFGVAYMISLLFSFNYPGDHVEMWQYFGASLDHSVLALCFLSFIFGQSDEHFSVRSLVARSRRDRNRNRVRPL